MDLVKDRLYTKKEYFDLLEQSDTKLEYHDGRIFAMAGGTSDHNIIAGKTYRYIDEKLDHTDCIVYNSDMAVYIKKYNRYVYPDVSVVCSPREFEDKKQVRLKKTSLIIEILSESTGSYDRGDKFLYYRSLPSFKEYILISSTHISAEGWYREAPDLWRISSAASLDDSVPIHSLKLELSLRSIYSKTELFKKTI